MDIILCTKFLKNSSIMKEAMGKLGFCMISNFGQIISIQLLTYENRHLFQSNQNIFGAINSFQIGTKDIHLTCNL